MTHSPRALTGRGLWYITRGHPLGVVYTCTNTKEPSVTTALAGDRDDLMWFVGLAEGEACFDLARGKYARIRFGMTDRDSIGRAATLMGVRVNLSLKKAPQSPLWRAEITGERAADIMREVLPHMGARRSQKIAEVLSAVEYHQDTRGRKSIPGPSISRPAGILIESGAAA